MIEYNSLAWLPSCPWACLQNMDLLKYSRNRVSSFSEGIGAEIGRNIKSGATSSTTSTSEPGALIKISTMTRLAPQLEGGQHWVLSPQHLWWCQCSGKAVGGQVLFRLEPGVRHLPRVLRSPRSAGSSRPCCCVSVNLRPCCCALQSALCTPWGGL